MRRNIILSALALTAILAFSSPASAQRGRGGYGGGGYGGYRGGYGGGYGGYGGYRGGYGGYGYGHGGYGYGHGGYGYGSGLGYGIGLSSGIALGSTLGGYGYGGYGYNSGYALGYSSYAPSYSGYNYVPATRYVDPGYPGIALAPADSSRESLYYAPETADNTAHLRILVPADAKLWVGGMQTEKQGSERDFNSPALTPGKSYTYEVKARWMQAGEPVEKTRKVKVMANQTTTVEFGPLAEVDK